jgi:uncharacterized membrane protein YheB (UPF0754 family)
MLMQNASFGITTYFLAFILGMMSFYIHSDLNSKHHYAKKSFEESNSIRAIVTTTLKPNEKYNKYFISLSHFNDSVALYKSLLRYYEKKGDFKRFLETLNHLHTNFSYTPYISQIYSAASKSSSSPLTETIFSELINRIDDLDKKVEDLQPKIHLTNAKSEKVEKLRMDRLKSAP